MQNSDPCSAETAIRDCCEEAEIARVLGGIPRARLEGTEEMCCTAISVQLH